jgi:hypothetical protein
MQDGSFLPKDRLHKTSYNPTLRSGSVIWLMHNDLMPLNIANAPQQKAALAQGGFFAFAIPSSITSPSVSPTIHATATRTHQTC